MENKSWQYKSERGQQLTKPSEREPGPTRPPEQFVGPSPGISSTSDPFTPTSMTT